MIVTPSDLVDISESYTERNSTYKLDGIIVLPLEHDQLYQQ